MLETCVLLAEVKVHELWQGWITVQMVSSFTGFDLTKQENMLLFE